MGNTVAAGFKTIFEQTTLIRNRTTFINERQKQTNALLKIYFLTTFIILANQFSMRSIEDQINNNYIDYRAKLERERQFIKETL
ncbi:hypothetical protein pb186bvf_014400 [Paramecium bursaria]